MLFTLTRRPYSCKDEVIPAVYFDARPYSCKDEVIPAVYFDAAAIQL